MFNILFQITERGHWKSILTLSLLSKFLVENISYPEKTKVHFFVHPVKGFSLSGCQAKQPLDNYKFSRDKCHFLLIIKFIRLKNQFSTTSICCNVIHFLHDTALKVVKHIKWIFKVLKKLLGLRKKHATKMPLKWPVLTFENKTNSHLVLSSSDATSKW